MKFNIHLIFFLLFPFSVLKEQCGILLKHPLTSFKQEIPILYIFEHYQQKR